MRIRVLGSSAGGGLPQWNCHCSNCQMARANDKTGVLPRTQSSIALTDNGEAWVIFNASPDIRQQLNDFAEIHTDTIRGTKIAAILLVDSQIDHTVGLMILREGNTLALYCTPQVYHELTSTFPVVTILQHYCGIIYHPIHPGELFTIEALPALEFTPIGSLSKPPPYSNHRQAPQLGDNLAFSIHDKNTDKTLLYAPAIEKIDTTLYEYIQSCDYLLLDGTFWQTDEMRIITDNYKKSYEMGHLAYSGPEGMIAQLKEITCPKTLIHINNTNPVLNTSSSEYQQLKAAGFDLAYDHMEIVL